MTWTITSVPLDGLKGMWPVVTSLLVPAVAYSGGRLDMRSVFEGLTASRYLLWVAYRDDKIVQVVFITRVARYPRRSMLVIELCGGSRMREWIEDASDLFRRFAADSGLDGVELVGRHGWARALARCGWRQEFVVVSIDALAR